MGVGAAGIDLLKELAKTTLGGKIPNCPVVIFDIGVLLRKTPSAWTETSLSFVKNLFKAIEGTPHEFLAIIGDRYDLDAPHRRWTSQNRSASKFPEDALPPTTTVEHFMDIENLTPEVLTSQIFNWLVNNRNWRLSVLVPSVTQKLVHHLQAKFYAANAHPEVVVRSMAITKEGQHTHHIKGDALVPTNRHDKHVRPDLAEADVSAASYVLEAMEEMTYRIHKGGKPSSILLVSGDQDLALMALRLAETYAITHTTQPTFPAFYLRIHDCKLGEFDVWKVRSEVRNNVRFSMLMGLAAPGWWDTRHEAQLLDVGLFMVMLGKTDYASSIPQLSPSFIKEGLRAYFAQGLSNECEAPSFLSPDEKSLLRGRAHGARPGLLIWYDDKHMPHLNVPAWLNIIAVAISLKTKKPFKYLDSSPCHGGEGQPKVTASFQKISMGFIMAHLARALWSLRYNMHECLPHSVTPPFISKTSGYAIDPVTSLIVQVDEMDPRPFFVTMLGRSCDIVEIFA